MPIMSLTAAWDVPEPDVGKVQEALMELGFFDIDVNMDDDSNPHGWGV